MGNGASVVVVVVVAGGRVVGGCAVVVGACTVVVAEAHPVSGELTRRTVNSCIQFLPTLDGKALLTVEDVTRSAGPGRSYRSQTFN